MCINVILNIVGNQAMIFFFPLTDSETYILNRLKRYPKN